MFLHKRSNGYYYVHFCNEAGKWQGVSARTRLKTEAHRFFSDLKRNLHKKPSPTPLSDFADQYTTYSQTNHSPQSTTRLQYVLKHFTGFIGDAVLERITAQKLEAYKAHRLTQVSDVTVNIELRTLKAFFSMAVKWGLLEKSPFKHVKLVRIAEQSPTYLTREDARKLLSAMKPRWLRDIVFVAFNTGMRRGELINLKWQDVDFTRLVLFVRNTKDFRTKSRTERVIPLNSLATNVLKELPQPKSRSEYVFTNSDRQKLRGKYVSECFREAVRQTDLNRKLHFHSLRHTFASWLVQDGVSLYEVQKLLGHSSAAVTQVYSHLQPENLHSTVNRISIPLN